MTFELQRKINLIKKIIKFDQYGEISLNSIRDNLLRRYDFISLREIKKFWKELLLENKGEINLYTHIPFCRSKCFYCREDSVKISSSFREQDYLKYLLYYMNEFLPMFKDVNLNSFYIGGGSPSILSDSSIEKLLKKINEFKFKKNSEKTFEFNPNSMTINKIDILRKYGVNRVSFGVQTLTPGVLEKVGRMNPSLSTIKELIGHCKTLNFADINVDLILGLKDETEESFLESFEKICKLQPNSVYIYPLQAPMDYEYIKCYYKGDHRLLEKHVKNLFCNLQDSLLGIAKKYGFQCKSKISPDNRIGLSFQRVDTQNITNHYEYLSTYPSSCLGIGIKARSRVFGKVEYWDEKFNNVYGHNFKGSKIDLDFEIATYIIRTISDRGALNLEEFKHHFNVNFLQKFSKECSYLVNKNLIMECGDEIQIKTKDEDKKLKIALLFLSIKQLEEQLYYFGEKRSIKKKEDVFHDMANDYVRLDVSDREKAIMISRVCNNACLMCHSATNYAPDYSKNKIFEALEKIDGTEDTIQLSGGEPTIRNDFPAILKEIKKRNKNVWLQVNSNARRFCDKEFVQKSTGFIDLVMTEIHGLEETHDKITQKKGSFNETIQGIKNLCAKNVQVKIIVLINGLNFKKLPEIAEYLKGELENVLLVSFEYTWFVGNAYKNRNLLFVQVSKISEYLQKAVDILGDKCVIKHFPLCALKVSYRKYVEKQNFVVDKREKYPLDECNYCLQRENCGGIWKNYQKFVKNLDEFKPIKGTIIESTCYI